MRPEGSLALIAASEQIRAARLRPREARVLGLRAAGYSRAEIAELTGESRRTIDRQLGRARRKLRDALRAVPAIGSGHVRTQANRGRGCAVRGSSARLAREPAGSGSLE